MAVLVLSSSAALFLLFQNCSGVKFVTNPAVSSQAIPPVPLNNAIPPLLCQAGNGLPTAMNYYPSNCLVNPNLPANSLGLEMNNNFMLVSGGAPNIILIPANDTINGTAADTELYIELATYVAPDTVVISSIDGQGNETEILNICNISTYSQGDPTNSTTRPYSDTILQFHVNLMKGTTTLKLDFTNAFTNTYVGIWNLNDFSAALANPATNPFAQNSNTAADWFRVMNGPLAVYNDNADPLVTEPLCP